MTGATLEQMSDAVTLLAGDRLDGPWVIHPQVAYVAKALVPPDHRIVSVEDLQEALEFLCDIPEEWSPTGLIARIRALIGEDQ